MKVFYEVLRGMIELAQHDYPSICVTIDQDEDGTWYDIVNISIPEQVNEDERENLESLGWVWQEETKWWTKRWKSKTSADLMRERI